MNVQTPESRRPSARSSWARTGALVLVSLVAIWTWVLFLRPGAVTQAAPEAGGDLLPAAIPAVPPVPELTPEQQQRRMVTGEWEDFYQGHRLLTIRDDGTALMVVELDGWGAALFASRLEFDIQWTLSDGRVVMKTTGGRPEGKVGVVLKMYGEKAEYILDALDNDRLVLRDVKTDKKFEWKHPTATTTTAAPADGLR